MTDRQALRATIDKAKRFNYQKVVMRITLAEEILNELETLSKSEWKLAGELTEAQMKIAELEEVLRCQNCGKICTRPDGAHYCHVSVKGE